MYILLFITLSVADSTDNSTHSTTTYRLDPRIHHTWGKCDLWGGRVAATKSNSGFSYICIPVPVKE